MVADELRKNEQGSEINSLTVIFSGALLRFRWSDS